MPFYAKDETKNELVITASKRAKRPKVFGKKKVCPFDAGNEKLTPPAVLALPNEKKWLVRVFENAFPALSRDKRFSGIPGPAFGDHEVIVETNKHKDLFQNLSYHQTVMVFEAYKTRYAELMKKPGVKSVFLFKNHGKTGGASIEHEHSQIMAFPFVYPTLDSEEQAVAKSRHCPYCAMLKKKKTVFENKHFACVIPEGSRFPYETWLIAKRHVNAIDKLSDAEGEVLVMSLQEIIRRFYPLSPDYVIAFHSSKKNFHFHVEVYPRASVLAGAELGAGVTINSRDPADVIAALKK
ncbi:MAG: DUF4931 domain-containing protein [Candidatus Micrarchaeota archaeon]